MSQNTISGLIIIFILWLIFLFLVFNDNSFGHKTGENIYLAPTEKIEMTEEEKVRIKEQIEQDGNVNVDLTD